jgi:glycosyltransferase involved in cell wall biosynthesis
VTGAATIAGGTRVVLIAPPWYPLPPHGYGGIELVVALLARQLRSRGRPLTVFGADGSDLGTTTCAPRGLDIHLGLPSGPAHELAYLAHVLDALQQLHDVAVIHDHSGLAGSLAAVALDIAPVVHTVHGRVTCAEHEFYATVGTRLGLVAISASQRQSAPTLPWLGVVHNAVDVDALRVPRGAEKNGYLLCLARVCPDKGQHHAIEVARRTGRRLILAGKIEPTPDSLAYYRELIEPAVDGVHVIHIENVGGDEKARLLARAGVLLAPIVWPEPFGLSMVEAMVSGTPVVAFRNGAAAELIDDGVGGFVVDDLDEMVAMVGPAAALDATRCAEEARRRFSPSAMAQGYLRIYDMVAQGSLSGVA